MQFNAFLGVDMAHLPDSYQRPLARLDLMQETILYSRYGKEGDVAACFEVSPTDLASAFSGVPITTGLLPLRCLFYSRERGQERLGVFLPAEMRELVAVVGGQRRSYWVPMPPLVFVGRGRDYWVHAVKQRPGENERLFRAPVPNVATNGGICKGDVEFPVASTKTIHDAAQMFLVSQFNDHLREGKSEREPGDVLMLWRDLDRAGVEVYPLDDLVATQMTLLALMGEDNDV